MRVLVVFAHPVAESFHASVHRVVLESLGAAGHQIDDLDLYAEKFDPVLSEGERRNYHDLQADRSAIQPYIDRLRTAEALVLCYPVWNFGFPAILKGYFDRVFLPGVTFDVINKSITGLLDNIKKIVVVTSYGAKPYQAFLAGDPPRKLVKRWLRSNTRFWTPLTYLALHDMDNVSQAKRQAFIDRVRATMNQL